MAAKDIYDLDLHECEVMGNIEVLRVPGGWVYSYLDGEELSFKRRQIVTSTFVPYDNEFMDEEEEEEIDHDEAMRF